MCTYILDIYIEKIDGISKTAPGRKGRMLVAKTAEWYNRSKKLINNKS